MNTDHRSIDKWYFGDYRGGFSGSRYNELTYITIFIFLVTVALSTEKSISQVFHTLYIPYIYNLIELYFFSDFIGRSQTHGRYTIIGHLTNSIIVRFKATS